MPEDLQRLLRATPQVDVVHSLTTVQRLSTRVWGLQVPIYGTTHSCRKSASSLNDPALSNLVTK